MLRGRKALELDLTGEKMVLHAEHLEKNLRSYMSSVRHIFDHITVSTFVVVDGVYDDDDYDN